MNVKLVVVEGRPLGAEIPLNSSKFVIGRDRGCQLRPKSPTVGGRQCAILRRGPHVTVRELGGDLGTLVNDRHLRRGDEVNVGDGDRLQVGQLIFTIRVESDPAEMTGSTDWIPRAAGPTDDDPAWRALLEAIPRPDGPPKAATAEAPPREAAALFLYRHLDEARGVICVGLGPSQLGDEAEIRATRRALFEMAGRRPSCRMVLDLGAVAELSSMAVAMLLALARRCEEGGSELRLCSAPERVGEVLERVGLGRVVGLHDDRAEAIRDPWEAGAGR